MGQKVRRGLGHVFQGVSRFFLFSTEYSLLTDFLFPLSFSKAFHKLIELGVPTAQFKSEPYALKTTEEQGIEA